MIRNCYRITLLITLMLFGVAAYADQGHIEKNGIRMPIKDTMLVYDKSRSELSIFMFPSRISSQDKQQIAKKNSAFSVLWNKPSPDKKKWQWYPYAMMRLSGKNGKVNDIADISNYYLLAYGIAEKNFTDNINGFFSSKNKPKSYKKRGSRVEFKFQGNNDFSKMKWNLSINAQAREK